MLDEKGSRGIGTIDFIQGLIGGVNLEYAAATERGWPGADIMLGSR